MGWAFPDANPGRLAGWAESVRAIPGAEAEPLLLSALLCGLRLGVARDDLVSVLEQLWSWLTSAPRNLAAPLADLLLEALGPGLKRVIEDRGWRFGADGQPVRKRGRPLGARAAWTAGFLVESELKRGGLRPSAARRLALDLVAVLLGRRYVEPAEFYRERKRMGNPAASDLALAIRERYESWLSREGAQARDAKPDSADTAPLAAWRARHRSLPQLLGIYGAPEFAQHLLSELPAPLWTPFLGIATAAGKPPRAKPHRTPAAEQPTRASPARKVRGGDSARRKQPRRRGPR